jgi:hypothetical protein
MTKKYLTQREIDQELRAYLQAHGYIFTLSTISSSSVHKFHFHDFTSYWDLPETGEVDKDGTRHYNLLMAFMKEGPDVYSSEPFYDKQLYESWDRMIQLIDNRTGYRYIRRYELRLVRRTWEETEVIGLDILLHLI